MASTMHQALDAVVTAIATMANGTGSYTYDLTSPGTVRLGGPVQTAARRSVRVLDAGFAMTVDGVPLGLVRNDGGCVVEGYIGATAGTDDTRYGEALDLASDIVRAIMSYGTPSRSLNGIVTDLLCTGGVGQDDDGRPMARVSVTWWFRSTTGV